MTELRLDPIKTIEAFGGTFRMAKALRLTSNSYCEHWKKSGKFPLWRIRSIEEAAKETGIDLSGCYLTPASGEVGE